jgi:hypothetical protein
MKKLIKEFAVDFMEVWDEDRPLFFLISFIIAFATALTIGFLYWVLYVLVIYPKEGFIALGAIIAFCLIPALLFLYGKHVKANE